MLFRHTDILIRLNTSKSSLSIPIRRLALRYFHNASPRFARSKLPPVKTYRQNPLSRSLPQGKDKIAPNISISQKIRGTLTYLIPWIPIFLVFEDHVATVMPVTGLSMWPLLNGGHQSDEPNDNDKVLVNQLYPQENLQRGMVIVFRSPHDPERIAIKRIVALAGDAITPLWDGYPGGRKEIIVPYNHMWVEGDFKEKKRNLDSNTYGPITQSLVVGKVAAVVWPLNRISKITWKDWAGCDRVREDAVAIAHPDDDLLEDALKLIESRGEDDVAKVRSLIESVK